MKVYTLETEQLIPYKIEDVFGFFKKPENLEKITPKTLGFKILTPRPIKMHVGSLIDYTIKIFGLPVHWTTHIASYEPPFRFADVQIKGPYAYWHHTHEFEEINGSTLMRDRVDYALPFGWVGRIAHWLFVRRQLKYIFEYRKTVIEDLFDNRSHLDITDTLIRRRENRNEVKPMKIVIAGGTGFVGGSLVSELIKEGHSLVLLSRNPNKVSTHGNVEVLSWDGKTVGEWARSVDGADAVINLAGEGIADKRWSTAQKEKIISSRINATRAMVSAIEKAEQKPAQLINASAVGYYGNVDEGDVPETFQKGTGFLADTCDQWEKEADKVETMGVRLVKLRIGVVLEKGGGAMSKILPPFQFFAGGPLGSGKQWFPWIHRDDVVGLIIYSLKTPSLQGAVNAAAPSPVTMKDFCSSLGKALGRPSWAPVPAFALKIMLGEMSEMLLEGQKVIPEKATKTGYDFKYPDVDSALQAILKK